MCKTGLQWEWEFQGEDNLIQEFYGKTWYLELLRNQ